MASNRPVYAAFARFDRDARAIADVEAFGLAINAGDTYVDLFTRHRTGAAGHRLPLDRIPAVMRPPGDGESSVVSLSTLVNPHEVFVDRLRLYSIDTLLVVPLTSENGVFWTGRAGHAPFTAVEISAFQALGEQIAAAFRAEESFDVRLWRLTRLESVDRILPVVGTVLDVREIFSHLSGIARSAMSHDMATIQVLGDDLERGRLFALDGASVDSVPQEFATNYPAVFNQHFLYGIHDNVTVNPLERERPAAKAGMRSVLRVPLLFDGRVGGALEFSAIPTRVYNEGDVPIARRIADYVSVAMAHQRLADETRRVAAVQERGRNLVMLDQLLPALTGGLDIRDVFDRVSEIAKQVIPHDALGLPLLTEDREHVFPLATSGLAPGTFPPVQPLPDGVRYLLTQPWEYEIFNDVTKAPPIGATHYDTMGVNSVLRVPIRLEGQLAGALVFFSRSAHQYSNADVMVAKRIADHVSLALSHQRLAEKARRNEELRARADRLELLDQLLATLTDAGELPVVFDRVSAIAHRVLPHDALTLPVLLPDGQHARVYAISGVAPGRMPDIVEIPAAFLATDDWEYDLVDDLPAQPSQRNLMAAQLGYRSALRVPIRLEGRFVAALAFLAFAPAAYSHADVIVARRVADRLAVSLARERRVEASRRADEASVRVSHLELRVRELTEELDARTGYRRVVGDSAPWRRVLTQATQVASTEATVLLLGDSGTGKEVMARFIHRASPRQDGPFVALNCAALPEQLLEAELFGYERGAFTGATQSKPGQLEQAGGGMLFLDEVGEMSLPAQAKFLRVLQEREFQRLGGTRVLRTDARIVAATNRDLSRAIEHGTFREDLFYRLNVFAINLPPLRERREDVLPLSDAFLAEFGGTLGRPPAGISRDARKMLMEYDWPGNVRELRNILERAAILCDGGLVTAEHLNLPVLVTHATPVRPAMTPPLEPKSQPGPREVTTDVAPPSLDAPTSPHSDIASMERAMVVQALEKHRFNKSKAAKELGLTRAQLYVRMKRHNLE